MERQKKGKSKRMNRSVNRCKRFSKRMKTNGNRPICVSKYKGLS